MYTVYEKKDVLAQQCHRAGAVLTEIVGVFHVPEVTPLRVVYCMWYVLLSRR